MQTEKLSLFDRFTIWLLYQLKRFRLPLLRGNVLLNRGDTLTLNRDREPWTVHQLDQPNVVLVRPEHMNGIVHVHVAQKMSRSNLIRQISTLNGRRVW